MVANKKIDATAIENALAGLTQQLIERHVSTKSFLIIGVVAGGIVLSKRIGYALEQAFNRPIPIGQVNIDFHRDDIGQSPIPAPKAMTEIPVEVNGATILLIDNVIQSGRSARAAINEIFDSGRPKFIEFLTLLDRGNRKLPIQPNYVGFHEQIPKKQQVKVTLNPDDPKQDNIIIQ